MSEYWIEKVRRRVTVSMIGGRTLDGEVFLQPYARYRSGPQDPAELFNEREAFVPLCVGGDTHILLSKNHISRVQFEADPADDVVGEPDVMVELVFADGARISGQLKLEARLGRARLLDFLNVDHQRFLALHSDSTVYLINFGQVAQVLHRQ